MVVDVGPAAIMVLLSCPRRGVVLKHACRVGIGRQQLCYHVGSEDGHGGGRGGIGCGLGATTDTNQGSMHHGKQPGCC